MTTGHAAGVAHPMTAIVRGDHPDSTKTMARGVVRAIAASAMIGVRAAPTVLAMTARAADRRRRAMVRVLAACRRWCRRMFAMLCG